MNEGSKGVRYKSIIQTVIGLACVGSNNPPVLQTNTQETENLDKAIFS
jgi:hypothetical protein